MSAARKIRDVRMLPVRRASRLLFACSLWALLFGCEFFRFSSPSHADDVEGDRSGVCGNTGKPCSGAENGARLTCFNASALGGEDFCTEACEPALATEDEGSVCAAAGAKLARCHPNGQSDAADCPAGLNCYRTSLIADQGVCIKMPVCSRDSDCSDPTHETCSSSLVADRSSKSELLHLDHLNCVHRFCVALASACVSGEGCLGKQYFSAGADLCTPSCDANLHCPPNYSCLRTTSGAGSASLCLPGLPGFRCTGDSCVVGTCQDSGADFNICTSPCATETDCELLNTSEDAFYCLEGAGHLHCVTPRPFHGANCFETEQCNAERNEICSHFGPNGGRSNRGECRVPCKPDGTCDSRGGLPHVCLANGEGGCFPGEQGLACKSSAECLPGLSCVHVPAEPALGSPAARICTRPCGPTDTPAGDGECNTKYAVNGGGYCGGGYCRIKRGGAQSCTRDAHCESNLCDGLVCVVATTPPLN